MIVIYNRNNDATYCKAKQKNTQTGYRADAIYFNRHVIYGLYWSIGTFLINTVENQHSIDTKHSSTLVDHFRFVQFQRTSFCSIARTSSSFPIKTKRIQCKKKMSGKQINI